ncbi:transposase [Paenibacillus sp. MER TA 81-3]|uniref:transposase n=1 Tax=Paenibacillus sp. MER TA 81-3 TaxID=2939573 RepID=UPI00203B9754|nr:transposase [Paenibacillus sp. MER TA 81-3]MCM3338307.1 transposase [Paenibacillus sp. MER TA 81-3]
MEALQSIATLEDLQRQFHTQSSCVSFLYKLKWPHGFVCPRCQHAHAYIIQTRRLPLYECRACRHQTSLIAGTIMEGSRTSLQKWLTAFWLVSRSDIGINAVRLSLIIEVTYKTAWLMLHKIRAAISRADTNRPLTGEVHGFVTFYARHPSRQLNSGESPLIVAESVTLDGEVGELKMKLVEPTRLSDGLLLRSDCEQFANLHVAKTTTETSIIRHNFRIRRNSPLYQSFKCAWRWMNDTFHGIGAKYLQTYLDEFCFRFNTSLHHTSAWEQLLCLCVAVFSPASTCTLYDKTSISGAPTAA